MNKLLLVFIAATAATWTTPVAADFGDYRSHEQQGQSLLVTTDVGQLRITVIDEAGFEVHYVADGSTQYPSFALAGPPPQLHARLEETDATLVFAIDPDSDGTRLTIDHAKRHGRSFRVVNPFAATAITDVEQWLNETRPTVLNIAGNRESKAPGIQRQVERVLQAALRRHLGD